jgi:predicted exporter
MEVVATWIIALAIIAGVLLLMLLVIGLMKVSTVCSDYSLLFIENIVIPTLN